MNTEQIIKDAAFKLMEEGRFENLTVQDILDEAHVGRTTFYRYFHDKYELMASYYISQIEFVKSSSDGYSFRKYVEATYLMLDNCKQYFNNVKDTTGQNSFWEVLSRYTYEHHKSRLQKNNGTEKLTEKEIIQLEFLTAGVLAIVKSYLNKPEGTVDMKPYVDTVCSLFPAIYQ